jgi:hypothetical protein
MAIFSTKDFNSGKSDKVRAAVGRYLALPGPASNNQVGDWLTQKCREIVQTYDHIDYQAAEPAPDQL